MRALFILSFPLSRRGRKEGSKFIGSELSTHPISSFRPQSQKDSNKITTQKKRFTFQFNSNFLYHPSTQAATSFASACGAATARGPTSPHCTPSSTSETSSGPSWRDLFYRQFPACCAFCLASESIRYLPFRTTTMFPSARPLPPPWWTRPPSAPLRTTTAASSSASSPPA